MHLSFGESIQILINFLTHSCLSVLHSAEPLQADFIMFNNVKVNSYDLNSKLCLMFWGIDRPVIDPGRPCWVTASIQTLVSAHGFITVIFCFCVAVDIGID